jgi:undecaprenyl diphosphate synthase
MTALSDILYILFVVGPFGTTFYKEDMGSLKKWFGSILKIPGSSGTNETLVKVPTHVAVILDGNGRWAAQRGLPRTAGHRAGLERVRDLVEVCLKTGVKYLTLYAFSTENWQRPADEVHFLMSLFEKTLPAEIAKLHQYNVKVRFIGLKQGLSANLVKLMEQAEMMTAGNHALTVNFAINYGGRSEIIAAVKGLLRAAQKNEFTPENISEAILADHLFTAGQPDPDLLIRPGGERRISNFLIWQSAYTEMYFSDLYWPDFGKNQILKAFYDYSQRKRRFGRIKEE